MSFGSRLKELRLKNKLTQEALAAKLYVSRQAVTKWEGSKGLPDEETIAKLAEIFNVEVEYFFKEDAPEPRPKHNRLKLVLITIISLLALSIAYVIIHFTYVVPLIIKNQNEMAKRESIVVASYISFNAEDLTVDEIKASNYPYLIKENDEIITNKFRYEDYYYILNVPIDNEKMLYHNELIYNANKDEYRSTSVAIEEYNYGFGFHEASARIERRDRAKELTIYSYDSKFNVIKTETFKRDNKGIYSDLEGYINKPYLDTYSVDGAFQYSLVITNTYGRKDVISIPEGRVVETYLIPDDWLSAPYSFETKFII